MQHGTEEMTAAPEPGLSALPGSGSSDPLLLRKLVALARKHLDKATARLFKRLTGLHFHVAWAPAGPRRWTGEELPRCCSEYCSRAGAKESENALCRVCGPRHLALALRSDHRGHRFTCPLGMNNFWVPIVVQGLPVGIAFVQALDKGRAFPSTDAGSTGQSVVSGARWPPHGQAEFDDVAGLLRLVVKHVEAEDLAELSQEELGRARAAEFAHEREEARLRMELCRVLPIVRGSPAASARETRAERTVHRLLDYIHRNYSQPITLRQCAGQLGMNHAYLSALFSRTVGLPFKAYLTELRLENAKEQLSDPAKPISEVARENGYRGENRFRQAFKAATGLSPRAWRESLRAG